MEQIVSWVWRFVPTASFNVCTQPPRPRPKGDRRKCIQNEVFCNHWWTSQFGTILATGLGMHVFLEKNVRNRKPNCWTFAFPLQKCFGIFMKSPPPPLAQGFVDGPAPISLGRGGRGAGRCKRSNTKEKLWQNTTWKYTNFPKKNHYFKCAHKTHEPIHSNVPNWDVH